MSNPISHIFDHSSCLSMKQLREYVAGNQTHEERHATEHHLNDCSLCSEAVEGLFARKGEAANLNAAINSNFLKQHISATHPQDHAPASHPVRAAQRRPRFARSEAGSPMAFAPLVSAVFILFGYVLWQKTQPVAPKGNVVHAAAAPTGAADPTPEAIVIPVRHKTGKPQVSEPEVVNIPDAAKAEVEAMRKAQITAVGQTEVKPLPKPVSLRPGVVTEMPKSNMMTVVSGGTASEVSKPAMVNLRKPDESKPVKRPELQAFKVDGHAATRPDVQVLNKLTVPAATKPDAQALNKPSAPAANKPEGRAVVRPEPYPSNKPDVQTINKAEAQALNLPKSQPAPSKPEIVETEPPRGAAEQFESHEAAMNAARNLQKSGKGDEARQILNDLAGSSGAPARQARKMLRRMNNGQE